jgi:hypothetical protein
LPEAETPRAFLPQPVLKEIVMSEELEMELEIVELGDAKEETKGIKPGPYFEDNPAHPTRDVV